MRTPPQRPACQRVELLIDQALSEGVLNLPPELQAHAAHCPRCGREYSEVSQLLTRLRGAAAGIDLGKVPSVVDLVMTAPSAAQATHRTGRRPVSSAWVFGQLAAVVAMVVLMVGGLTYALLKVNQAVGGLPPERVVERVLTPFQGWTWTRFRGTR